MRRAGALLVLNAAADSAMALLPFEALSQAGSAVSRWCTSAEESAFVRVEVRRSGGHMAAFSNPILLA